MWLKRVILDATHSFTLRVYLDPQSLSRSGEIVLSQIDTPTYSLHPGARDIVGETDIQFLRCNWSFPYDGVSSLGRQRTRGPQNKENLTILGQEGMP